MCMELIKMEEFIYIKYFWQMETQNFKWDYSVFKKFLGI